MAVGRIGRTKGVPGNREWQPHPEGRSFAGSALDTDGSTHSLHQQPADGQTEARAAIAAGGGRVRLGKRSNSRSAVLAVHTDARIGHLELHDHAALGDPVDQRSAQHHFAGLGELDGVAGQVQQDLPQPRRRRPAARRAPRVESTHQLQALAPRPTRPPARATSSRQSAQVEVDRLQLQLARFDLREIEDVVDDAEQRLARRPDAVGVVALRRRRARCRAAGRSAR